MILKNTLKLENFFNIKSRINANKKFNLLDFFKYLDNNLKPIGENSISRKDKAYLYRLEEPEAIFYKTMILWDIIHIKNNTLKGNVTAQNRSKVQSLLPDLYNRIKDKNISVRFTAKPLNEKEEQALISREINKNNL